MQPDTSLEPVSDIVWHHRDELKPNDYNPNRVAPPELDLLIVSILEDGWTQPIVALPDLTIVDGFHRWHVSGMAPLLERYGGWVPVSTVRLDPVHRKMSTIRHNRARGTHAILPMADIIVGMIRDGVPATELATRLGMEDEEIIRLATSLGMPELGASAAGQYAASWVPAPPSEAGAKQEVGQN